MVLFSEEERKTSEELLQNSMMTLKGEVVHGKALGRTVGMPTANLRVEGEELPQVGVYATRIKIGDTYYNSVTNVGQRPSVDDEKHITVESFIFDFYGDIYGKMVELEFHKFLRCTQKFEDLQAVQKQVEKDVLLATEYFKTI